MKDKKYSVEEWKEMWRRYIRRTSSVVELNSPEGFFQWVGIYLSLSPIPQEEECDCPCHMTKTGYYYPDKTMCCSCGLKSKPSLSDKQPNKAQTPDATITDDTTKQLLEEIVKDIERCWLLPSAFDNEILYNALSANVKSLLTKYQQKLNPTKSCSLKTKESEKV